MSGNPSSPLQLEMRLKSPAEPREESQVPPHNRKGGLTRLGQLEWFPEIPITTLEDPRNSNGNLRGNSSFLPQLEKNQKIHPQPKMRWISLQRHNSNPKFPFTTWKETWLTFVRTEFPQIPFATREEPKASCCNTKKYHKICPPPPKPEMRPCSN